ncbi:MAG: hypothetical protein KIT81_03390 [Alphaproteobacteria bacterium]|nr:hypothetical protein [Alphaproteobacteria bacterium]
MKHLPILFAAVLLAGCVLRPAPVVDASAISRPAANVPARQAAFSGIWFGTWLPALDSNIAIETVAADGRITGTYAWGDHPEGRFVRGSAPVTGRIEGNRLTLAPFENGAVVSYVMRADGALDGEFNINGNISRGEFRKK